MIRPIDENPVDAVYPIVPNGPAVVVLNEYSVLYRVAIQPPPRTTPPEPTPPLPK